MCGPQNPRSPRKYVSLAIGILYASLAGRWIHRDTLLVALRVVAAASVPTARVVGRDALEDSYKERA